MFAGQKLAYLNSVIGHYLLYLSSLAHILNSFPIMVRQFLLKSSWDYKADILGQMDAMLISFLCKFHSIMFFF